MMKIQEGQVKYKDRTDIKCTYGIADDGKQYYFLDPEDQKRFSNNGRIASTELKEAIDPMAPSSHIGVVSEDGTEIIPCSYKSIKPVNDSIVLAEAATPVSQGVIEAVQLKQDPLAATKLVSTPALIKDKFNTKMGSNGRYLFNNLFSEATAFDINGNNLWNNEYYSFIATTDDKIYFSKNTVDSEVNEYSMLPPEVQNDVTPASDTNDLDVTNLDIPQDAIENALNNESTAQEVATDVVTPIAPVEEKVEESIDEFAMPKIDADDAMENNESISEIEIPVASNEPVNQGEDTSEVIYDPMKDENFQVYVPKTEEEKANETTEEAVYDPMKDENFQVYVPKTEEEKAEETTEEAVYDPMKDENFQVYVPKTDEEKVEETEKAEETTEEAVYDPMKDENFQVYVPKTDEEKVKETEEVENTTEEETVEDTSVEENEEEPVSDIFEEEIVDTKEDTTLDNMVNEVNEAVDVEDDMKEDIFDTSIKADKIEFDDEFDETYENSYNEPVSRKDTTMMEVAKSMAGLIKQNKDLKNTNKNLNDKYDKLSNSRKNVIEKARMLEEKVDALSTKNQNLDNKIIKLESRNDMLENRTRDQERIIESQRRELDNLRSQLEGKEELSRLLQDAKVMLEDNNSSYRYDEDNYYRRAA